MYLRQPTWIEYGPQRPRAVPAIAAASRGCRTRSRGIGMYPDETCFDPTRPSFLPYWLDTFGEEACYWNELISGNQTGNTAQPGPAVASLAPGSPGAPDAVAVQNAAAACAARQGSWDPSTETCSPASAGSNLLPWIAGGAAVLLLAGSLMGKR